MKKVIFLSMLLAFCMILFQKVCLISSKKGPTLACQPRSL